MDKPIISRYVEGCSRSYFIDGHIDRKGQKYIVLTEMIKYGSPGEKKKQHIYIHADYLDKVIRALQTVGDLHLKQKKSDG